MAPQPTRATYPRLLKRVIREARERQLFFPGQHLLVALSGGPDSTALLALLVRLAPAWRLKLTAAHVNYRLRGAESDDDEAFVSGFCKDRQVPVVVLRPVLKKQRRRSSLQQAARDARYGAMKQLAQDIGADRIVVGHTANDQAETVLMWMLRGAALTGLAGMAFVRESIIVRPLLSSTKEDVLEFLHHERLSYRQDSSNASDRYLRNRIRHELLPVMVKIAPAAIGLLQRLADLVREDERYMEQAAHEQFLALVKQGTDGGPRLDRRAFASLSPALQRRLVRMMLRMYEEERRAPSLTVVEATRRFFLTGKDGTDFSLRNVHIMREGGTLYIGSTKRKQVGVVTAATAVTAPTEVTVAVPSTVSWAGTHTQFHVQVMSRREAEPLIAGRSTQQALFDADLISSPLVLRRWRPGDRLYPSGMKGKSKKLQDLFTDMKIPRTKRESIPVLVALEGILWVAGVRQDERFLVRDESRRCLVVTMIDESVREGAR